MRVLGVDPGLAHTGFGIVESERNRLSAVHYGVISSKSSMDLADRLKLIHDGIRDLAEQYKPTDASVEQVFRGANARTSLLLGHARGAAIVALASAGLAVSEFSPLEVKQAVVGYGRASKEQVQEMVRVLLNLESVPKPEDAADALAVAICRIHSQPVESREIR